MSDINFAALAVQVDFLIRRRFGKAAQDALGGRRVTRHQTEREKRLIQEAEDYQAELSAMSPEQVRALYEEEQANERMERQQQADRTEAQMFFNQPGADADFAHWSKAAYWTLDEAIALSFGKAPEVVCWKKVEGYVGRRLMSELPVGSACCR